MNPHVACCEGVLEKHLCEASWDLAAVAVRHEDEANPIANLIVILAVRACVVAR